MARPIIGLLGNLMFINEVNDERGFYRNCINQEYVECIREAGGIPFILPIPDEMDMEMLEAFIEKTDGLLVPGGYDLAPYLYGEEPHRNLGITMIKVDRIYVEAVKLAAKHNKPVLGICKGLQAINVAYGGTLYQDLPTERPETMQHVQKGPRPDATHYIVVKDGSVLSKCFPDEKVLVNSHHHQSVKQVAEGFKVTAETADGVIEAIEKNADGDDSNIAPVIGVQWHPEMMAMGGYEEQKEIFREFVQICACK